MAVIKIFEKLIFSDETNPIYLEINKMNEKGKCLERREAMEVIREKGLVVSFKSKYGTIWDTSDKEFYKRYQGKSKRVKNVPTP